MTEESTTSKRKRQTYYPKSHGGQQKRRRRFDLRHNGRGILVTAGSANHTREAIREAMTVVKAELKDAASPSETPAATDVSEALDEELAQLKEDSERIIPIKDLTKGVSFLQFASMDDSPNELVYKVLNRISPANPFMGQRKETDEEKQEHEKSDEPKETSAAVEKTEEKKKGRISCRFMNRLVPIEITCPPHMENFKRAMRLLIEAYFPESELALHPEKFEEEEEKVEFEEEKEGGEKQEGEEGKESVVGPPKKLTSAFIVPSKAAWAVQFERRAGMKTLDRDIVINEIGRMVGENYTVNLGRPEYSIIVEVNNTFCGLSVVRDFSRLLRYNIHRLCHPDEDGDREGKGKRGNNKKEKEEKEEEEEA